MRCFPTVLHRSQGALKRFGNELLQAVSQLLAYLCKVGGIACPFVA